MQSNSWVKEINFYADIAPQTSKPFKPDKTKKS